MPILGLSSRKIAPADAPLARVSVPATCLAVSLGRLLGSIRTTRQVGAPRFVRRERPADVVDSRNESSGCEITGGNPVIPGKVAHEQGVAISLARSKSNSANARHRRGGVGIDAGRAFRDHHVSDGAVRRGEITRGFSCIEAFSFSSEARDSGCRRIRALPGYARDLTHSVVARVFFVASPCGIRYSCQSDSAFRIRRRPYFASPDGCDAASRTVPSELCVRVRSTCGRPCETV